MILYDFDQVYHGFSNHFFAPSPYGRSGAARPAVARAQAPREGLAALGGGPAELQPVAWAVQRWATNRSI